MSRPRILIVAGEASGDAHGAGLVRALKRGGLAADFYGIGGPALAAEGVRLMASYRDLAVVGIAEVVGRLPRIFSLLGRVRAEIARRPPDLFVPIDSPDFNLRLLRPAAARGVPVVYFIAPQLWAWRPQRVRVLSACVRELLVLFPFEEAYFRERGVSATFVGNPLADAARARPRGAHGGEALGLLLPGSRSSEIGRHLPVLAKAVALLEGRFPDLRWLVRRAPEVDLGQYARHLRPGRIELAEDPIPDLAERARVVVSASGTASLEAALSGTPLLVVYRMNPLTYRLARRLVHVPHIAMANLAAGRAIVPELLQDECTPERVAAEVAGLLTDHARRAEMGRALAELRERFGPPGAYERAAARVRAHLESPREAQPSAAPGPGHGPQATRS